MNNNYKSKYTAIRNPNSNVIQGPIPGRVYRGYGKFLIYPDSGWKKEWGQKPLLGIVFANDEFYAVREAYTEGIVPLNFTFGLMAKRENYKTIDTNKENQQ